ncbi:hypothetical protein GCM10023259_012560 [Thermocatellispora tengchongensis]
MVCGQVGYSKLQGVGHATSDVRAATGAARQPGPVCAHPPGRTPSTGEEVMEIPTMTEEIRSQNAGALMRTALERAR